MVILCRMDGIIQDKRKSEKKERKQLIPKKKEVAAIGDFDP